MMHSGAVGIFPFTTKPGNNDLLRATQIPTLHLQVFYHCHVSCLASGYVSCHSSVIKFVSQHTMSHFLFYLYIFLSSYVAY